MTTPIEPMRAPECPRCDRDLSDEGLIDQSQVGARVARLRVVLDALAAAAGVDLTNSTAMWLAWVRVTALVDQLAMLGGAPCPCGANCDASCRCYCAAGLCSDCDPLTDEEARS